MAAHDPDLAEVLGHDAADKRIDILRRIGEVGSISEAARGAGVSYKAAWQALETLGNLAGTPLVAKAVGGSGGGGAALTPAGQRVLEAAALFERARAEVLAVLTRAPHGAAVATPLAAMGLRTSLRNQFPCRVQSLTSGAGFVRVELTWPDGGVLFARITRESAQLLGLARGMAVLALCKATAVQVAPQLEPVAGRNLLPGTVTRVSRSAQGGEVGLQLAGAVRLVGFAAPGHGLRAGRAAMAAIDESGVVLAVAG
jgi:molybdate transport system regulatory protein